MRLGDLGPSELAIRLEQGSLALRVGPFVTRLATPIRDLSAAIALLYPDFPVVDATEVVDFYIRVSWPRGLRRWWRPQSVFLSDGRVIFKPFPLRLALPLLEWGWNWCISTHAHRYLIVHCAVIERGGLAALLPGPPGSGKSTLCAALVHRGWRLLSDELALLSLDDGAIAPVPRPVSLKNESIDVIRRFAPDAVIGPLSTDTHKGTVAHMRPPVDSVRAADQRARVAWIIFPRFQAEASAVLEAMPRSRAFLRVVESTFNYTTLGVLAFDALAQLFDGVDTYEFSYGRLDDAVELFAGLRAPCDSAVPAA
jgi:HprK-related kinase A